MAGARSLQCSHQPAKEALDRILRDSTTFLRWFLPPTITSNSRTEAPIVGKNGFQCCFLEREESGQHATCSGEEGTHRWPLKQAGFPDLNAGRSSGKPLCNASMRDDDGTFENANFAHDVEAAFSTPLHVLVAGKKWFGHWGQKRSVRSDGQGLHGRSALLWPSLVSLQKAGFATGAPQPVPSPLQMIPSPIQAPEGAPDLDSDAEPKTAQCVAKSLPMSPYKLNLVAKMVRGMSVQEALDQLEASPKRAAVPVYKAIHSARANAGHSHDMDTERLVIEKCFVGHGQHMRRISTHAKNRSGVRKRRRSHLTVVVKELEAPKAEKVKAFEARKYHPTQLRWEDRPKRAKTWVEELTARALEKKKQALNYIGKPVPR